MGALQHCAAEILVGRGERLGREVGIFGFAIERTAPFRAHFLPFVIEFPFVINGKFDGFFLAEFRRIPGVSVAKIEILARNCGLERFAVILQFGVSDDF